MPTRGYSRLTDPGGLLTQQLADSPLGAWALQETGGTTATDSSGNGRNGTYSGTYTLGQSAISSNGSPYSVTFGGGLVTVADAAWMDVSDWTVEALIYPTAVTSYRAWVCRDDGSSDRLWCSMSSAAYPYDLAWNTTPTLYYNNASAGDAYIANTAYLVATRWNSTTHKLDTIRNGTSQVSVTTTGTARTGAQPITIAQNAGGSFVFAGRISHVAFYGSALSDA